MAGRWRETIQFGGDAWVDTTTRSVIRKSPIHDFRFTNDAGANKDRNAKFVTGALQVIQLKEFIDVGGYNPSLEKNFQDVDICLNISIIQKYCCYSYLIYVYIYIYIIII